MAILPDLTTLVVGEDEFQGSLIDQDVLLLFDNSGGFFFYNINKETEISAWLLQFQDFLLTKPRGFGDNIYSHPELQQASGVADFLLFNSFLHPFLFGKGELIGYVSLRSHVFESAGVIYEDGKSRNLVMTFSGYALRRR